MQRVIYSIQGNIGSGKSTLLKALMNSMNQITTIPEPVDKWQQVAGYNLLDKYYEDPVRWGYTFQVNCILSRMTQLSKCIDVMKKDKIYISERSVQSDKFIFAKLMHKLKKMNDMEYNLYLQMFESIQNLFNKHAFSKREQSYDKLSLLNSNKYFGFDKIDDAKPQKKSSPIVYRHIYLKTSPEMCYERIKKRNRFEEKNLEFDYIKDLHSLHDEWLVNPSESRLQQSLIIDGQRQFQTDQKALNEMIEKIKSYLIKNSQIGDQIQQLQALKAERQKQHQSVPSQKYSN